MEKVYELIIVGAGPAGITASVYAARQKTDFLLLTGDVGGQTLMSSDIENYTGYQFITGVELSLKFSEHIKKYGIDVHENEKVIGIFKEDDIISVKTDNTTYKTKALIIASGKESKELNVPGEEEFKNRGLTYCATCDGPLFAGKEVVIVGGGNSALDAGMQLTKIAKKVYIINNASALRGDEIMRKKISGSKNVEVVNNSEVLEIFGDKFVSGVKIRTKSEEKILNVQGVFIEIGLIPNSGFAQILDKNELDEIKIDSHNKTSIQGIFAAGDVTDVPEKQIVVAAGEGSKAALSAFRYLAKRGES